MNSKELILPHKPELEVIQGGKPQLNPNWKPPVGSDWLSPLPRGTVFLSRNRGRSSGLLNMWEVCVKTKLSVKLFTELNQPQFIWVDAKEFCSDNNLQEILQMGIENEPGTNQE